MKISKRITATFAAAAVATAGSIGFYNAFSDDLTQAAAGNFQKSQKMFTDTAANEIERYFYDAQKRMETIAEMSEARNAVRSETCNQNLQNLLEINNREFSNLGRISKDGIFICAVNRAVVGEPAAKYGTYFATVAKDPEHKPATSRLIYPTGAGAPVVAVHVPVYDQQGAFNGTIGGAVYFNELQERILPDSRLSANSIMALYDDNLDILYHPDPLIRGKNLLAPNTLKLYSPRSVITAFANDVKSPPAEGTVHYDLRDEARQTVYKSVRVVDRYWTIGIAVPQKDVEASAGRQTVHTLFLIVLALLVVTVTSATFLLAKRKPIPTKHTSAT